MAASEEKIEESVLQDLIRQKNERSLPPEDVYNDLIEQRRLRNGDYPENTLPGAGQAVVGAAENLGKMIVDFLAAAPATVVGLAKGATVRGHGRDASLDAFVGGFDDFMEPVSGFTDPRTQKGKRYQEAIADTYNHYIEEEWGGHVGKLVDEGYITPEEGAYFRTSADALLMGLFMRAGAYARGTGAKVADIVRGREVKVDPLEGGVIPASAGAASSGPNNPQAPRPQLPPPQKKLPPAQKRLPPPEENLVADAARQDFAAQSGKSEPNIFLNRQAGAVDPAVFAEGISKILRPATATAQGAAALSHALARQIGYKQVSAIRDLRSPTAKILADRIMPSQASTIPLGEGFHEAVSMRTGNFNTRIDSVLAPLRRHVVNSNSAKSLRLIALPKKINNAIIRGLEEGVAPEKLVPAVRAIRAILDESLAYQRQAGLDVGERPNFFPHVWDASKIAKAEYFRGKFGGGDFTKHLVNDLGIPADVAPGIVRKILQEDGFASFEINRSGRLERTADGEGFSAWSRAQGVSGGQGRPAHTKKRSIETTVDKSGKWLVTDLESVLTNYINRSTNAAEYARITGPGEATLNRTVKQIIDEVRVAEQNSPSSNAQTPGEIAQGIYDMFDAMQHQFNPIKDPTVRGVVRGVSGWEVMAHLGLVALAQLPESLMPAVRYRVATQTKGGVPVPLKSYAVGIVDAVHNAASSVSTLVTGQRRIPKSEIRKHLESIGVAKVSALESSTARSMQTSGKVTSRFIRTVLMESITDLQRTVAYDTISSMIRQNAKYLASGTAQGKRARMYEQELIELGLKPQEVIDWYRAGMPKDSPIQSKLDTALVRGIDTTIIMPKAANSPRLYNDPRFQPALLFTRFFTVFGNTVIKNVFRKMADGDVTSTRKLASLGAVIASIGVAYYTQFLREDITGYSIRDEDDPMRIVDAVDRAGWTAMFTRLYPLVAGEYKYSMGQRYVTNLLGGPAGTDAAKLIEAMKGSNEQKARWMASMTPIANITPETEEELEEFYLELIEAAQDAID